MIEQKIEADTAWIGIIQYFAGSIGIKKDRQIREKWKDFVVEGLGCKCVEEEPWVTIAESSKFGFMALMNLGEANLALELFGG
ncbi:MAG: hypothetical protein Ct9H90mP4_04100 [Gammaproteobacteria bacterium]|nr:MAG: hypothetical protein Ct9H90mP4_04100 [Gammaproteobacteria bacterium]